MIGRFVALLAVAGCASVAVRPTLEGRTAAGIAYDVRGSGPTVVLIPGAVLDRRMWDQDAEVLAQRFRVVRYDLRAHGASADVSGPFDARDDLLDVLDAVKATRAHLVGLSAGGRVALDFALAHPDRVDRLVLASTAPSGVRLTERPAYFDSVVAAIQRGDVNRAAVVVAESPVMAVPADKAQWMRGIVLANARLFRQSPTAAKQPERPALSRLGEVRAPTLIIVGERDSRDVLWAADTMAKAIPGAKLVTMPGAPHLVNVWAPEMFDRVVDEFLDGSTRRR